MLHPTWLCAFFALALATPLAAQVGGKKKDKDKPPPPPAAPAPRVVPFPGKLEAARALAKERNVPIVVHVILEDEEASDRYRDETLKDQALVASSQKALVICSNNGTHGRRNVEEVVEGEKRRREMCAKYDVEECAHHKAAWDELYAEFKEESGDLKCPQTIVLGVDGKLAGRINTGGTPDAGEIVGMIEQAAVDAGPGLTDAQLALVKKTLADARAQMIAKDWPAAWRSFAAVLAIPQKTAFAEEANREQPKALAEMRAQLDAASALVVPGTAAKGYEQMLALQKTLAGTPLEKDVADRLKKAETAKASKDEIAAYKLGLEAEAILAQAKELFAQKQDKKAEWQVKKLLSKRYAATEASKKARELWPNVKPDEEKPPAK